MEWSDLYVADITPLINAPYNYGSEGREFESLRAHQKKQGLRLTTKSFLFVLSNFHTVVISRLYDNATQCPPMSMYRWCIRKMGQRGTERDDAYVSPVYQR